MAETAPAAEGESDGAPARTTAGSARVLLLPLLAVCLAACAQEGDFGRPRAGGWNALVDTTGTIVAHERGEAAVLASFTDDETALRDRAWRFLMPAAPRAAFLDAAANLARARVVPPGWFPEAVAAYHEDLTAGPARSPVPLYRRLSEDAVADARLIAPFASVAARVIEADARRLRSLPLARTLDSWDVREAALRVAENRCLIAWVRLETGARIGRYRYALEHLFAALPATEAVQAERAVADLGARRGLLDPLLPADAAARCGLVPGGPQEFSGPLVVKD